MTLKQALEQDNHTMFGRNDNLMADLIISETVLLIVEKI